MPAKELAAENLYQKCELDPSLFETTDNLEPLDEILGQPRAVEAIRLGVEIKGNGYNIFALGHPGIGKRTLIRQFLQQRAPDEPTPSDWCYVNNFKDSDKPVALNLPSGRGPELRYDLDQLLQDVRTFLPQAFDTEEYRERSEAVQQEAIGQHQQTMEEISEEAEKKGFQVVWTQSGVVFNPLKDGEPMKPEEIEQLPEEEKERLQKVAEELQSRVIAAMQRVPSLHREARQKLEELNREVARQAFEPLIDELKRKYADLPDVVAHLKAIRQHLLKNAMTLMQLEQQSSDSESQVQMMNVDVTDLPQFRVYRTNVIVTHDEKDGAPVIYEENPTLDNLVGRVEYLSQMGALITDFNLIKPGALHRANGGYLIIDAHRLLSNPYAWDGLKQMLLTREIRIESMRSILGLMTTKSLEPEPIPLNVKVILLGSRLLFYLLQAYDPDFPELIKIPADFSEDMDRGPDEEPVYARLLATLVRHFDLQPFGRDAIERTIEHSARMAGDAQKLSVRIRALTGVLRESSYWAQQNGRSVVTRDDVQRAIDAHIYRSAQSHERIREGIQRGLLLVQTEGDRVGQVNGLAVFQFGDVRFGYPSRITARTRMGHGGLVDIEREVELGGPTHSKGVLILQGFVTGRYARSRPFALSGSLVFEQSYAGVEGDSASCAEVFALLSSISEIPLKQSFAVTGSVNQQGDVQAIGAVNEKIEGFFDVCNERGLDGNQGVLIPASNVQHLMLRQDVLDAVRDGKFHVYAMTTVDEGIEILTGMTAGEVDQEGIFPEGSFNAAVADKLSETAALQKKFAPVSMKDTGDSHD